MNDACFQRDSATYHTSHATINLLSQTFGGRLISRNGNVKWPSKPRSCDLTPLNYFLMGAVKEKYYACKSEAIEQLKVNISDAVF